MHPVESGPGEEMKNTIHRRTSQILILTLAVAFPSNFTTVFRTTDVGSSIGTNFGGIPVNKATLGKLTEWRDSGQNSRIGICVDANVKGAQVLG